MAKFVEFTNTEGRSVFVNPEAVKAVMPAKHSSNVLVLFDVLERDQSIAWIAVPGPVEEVIRKLEGRPEAPTDFGPSALDLPNPGIV